MYHVFNHELCGSVSQATAVARAVVAAWAPNADAQSLPQHWHGRWGTCCAAKSYKTRSVDDVVKTEINV
jgi:hypothetical protein